MLFSPKYQQAKNGVVTTATNVEPWIKQYKKLEEFSPEACMSSSFKHRWSQLFHIFAPAIHANISTSVQLDFFVFKQPIRQIRINSILFDSRAKAPLAKRSERGYGDENEWAHRETLEGEFWRSLPLPHSLVLCIRARFFLWVYWNIDSVVNSGWLVDTYCAPYYYFCVEVVTSFFVPIGSSICKKNTFDLKSVTFHDVHLFSDEKLRGIICHLHIDMRMLGWLWARLCALGPQVHPPKVEKCPPSQIGSATKSAVAHPRCNPALEIEKICFSPKVSIQPCWPKSYSALPGAVWAQSGPKKLHQKAIPAQGRAHFSPGTKPALANRTVLALI